MSGEAEALVRGRSGAETPNAALGKVEQHSLWQSIVLHILPGVLIVSLFDVTAPVVMQAGFPPLLAMATVGIGIGLAFQLGHLLVQGRRENGKWSLRGIVLFREPLRIWQYLLLVPLFTIAAFILDTLTRPLSTSILTQLSWLPSWFEMRDVSQLLQYSRSSLVLTFGVYLAFNGVVAPIVEEMYFRGYLLPRLSRFGRWTPVVELLLFTLYHFWQPYYYVTQFFGLLPVVMAVWWKRNIKLGIATHCTMNLIGGLLTAAMALGQT
jgi:membrane protease YdiL (CAAX protease family)